MNSTDAVRGLIDRDNDMATWFAMLCEDGPFAIEAQAWQVHASLKDIGQRCGLREVQDGMLDLAHELLPDSLGEDPYDGLFLEMTNWATKQPESLQERLCVALEPEAFLAARDGPLSGFRVYLRGLCEAAMREEAA